MYPTLFHVGRIAIYSFGLFLAIGIILGGLTVAFLSRRAHLAVHGLFDNVLFCIFGGVIGARLAYVITYPQYFHPPLGIWTNSLALWQGGLLFYGAIVGGLIAAWLVFRAERRGIWRWLDLLFAGLMIGVAFGQIGCFLGGCAVGVESSAKISILHRIPVQLFEAVWSFILALLVIVAYRRRIHDHTPGTLFLFGMIIFMAGRMILDIFRPISVHFHHVSGLIWADAGLLGVFMLIATLRVVFLKRKVVEMS